MSATHINPEPATIGVGGSFYNVIGIGTQVAGSDLILYELSRGVLPVPSLPAVSLTSAAAALGEFSLMTGRAYTNNGSAPYGWVNPDVSDAVPVRWATNTIESSILIDLDPTPALNVHRYLATDFDGPEDAGVTAYDGQGALGDSGGGLFIYRGGQWVLAGAAHFVDDGPDLREIVPTGDGVVDPSQHGDFTGYTDVFQHRGVIQGFTGILVPEPSAFLLGLMGLVVFLKRRR